MTQQSERTYKVGRGKPPAHRRFKPGQSGNLRGRPRGSVDVPQTFLAAASETVVITENGRTRRLTKLEVAARQVANKAASGDPRAIEVLTKVLDKVAVLAPVAESPADQAKANFGSEDDDQVLEAFLQRARKEGSS